MSEKPLTPEQIHAINKSYETFSFSSPRTRELSEYDQLGYLVGLFEVLAQNEDLLQLHPDSDSTASMLSEAFLSQPLVASNSPKQYQQIAEKLFKVQEKIKPRVRDLSAPTQYTPKIKIYPYINTIE